MLLPGQPQPVLLAADSHSHTLESIIGEHRQRHAIRAQGGSQLLRQDTLSVADRGLSQGYLLQLQLVAGDVVAQGDPLLATMVHEFDLPKSQFAVGGIDRLLMAEAMKLEVEADQEKTYPLALLVGRETEHLGLLLSQSYATSDGSARIYHLLGTQQEVVTKMWHRRGHGLAKRAIPQASITQIGDGELRLYVGELGKTCSLLPCLCRRYSGTHPYQRGVVLLRTIKELLELSCQSLVLSP